MPTTTRQEDARVRSAGLAVLCNPRSGRVRRRLDRVRRELRDVSSAAYREGSEPEEIGVAVRSVVAEGCGVLAVVGGDGTLQAVLTSLVNQVPRDEWPVLTVVPAGSTNMSAKDLGLRGSVRKRVASLKSWLDSKEPGSIVLRPAVKVEGCDGEVRCGLFFGGAAVAAGTAFFRERLYHKGLHEQQTSGLAIAWVLLQLLMGGARTRDFTPHVRCEVDGDLVADGPTVLCLVTALDRHILGLRPHWGADAGPLRFTWAKKDPYRLWTSIPRMATGRPGDRLVPDHGYVSRSAERVTLTFDGEYALDGELYPARREQGPVRITAVPDVRWLIV